ncbi:MAG: CBS domain-containing protein [Gammaproteobacteria bacterium]|nr:CBS domain-containing protein [Gammaproteobacteria bacterium]
MPDRSPPTRSWLDRLGHVFTAEPKDRVELTEILRDAEKRELFDAQALAMIEGALQVADMQVRDIMVPRAQMVCVERDEQPEDFVSTVTASGHSRFPILGDNRDDVEGILLAKDLLGYFAGDKARPFSMRDAMRPAVFVPESKRLNVLLRDFRTSRNHMAIVVDEYSGVAGLVTIEDVLEQIVGEIDDEHDVEESSWIRKLNSEEHTVKALAEIEEFNEYFGTELSDEEFDTVGGFVISRFGYLPSRDESCDYGGLRFTVLRADKRRIHLIRVVRIGEQADETPSSD